jgi:hypothetical protein
MLEDRRLLSAADLAGPVLLATPLAGGGASVAALASTVTLAAPADTYVQNGTYAGQNFGQAATVQVKNINSPGYDRRAYVRFDLTGVGSAADITSATVRDQPGPGAVTRPEPGGPGRQRPVRSPRHAGR